MSTYYHGGYPGIPVGGRVLPGKETRHANFRLEDRRYVSISPWRQHAALYALTYALARPHPPFGLGTLYKVSPIGKHRLNPSEPPCRFALAAKVLSVDMVVDLRDASSLAWLYDLDPYHWPLVELGTMTLDEARGFNQRLLDSVVQVCPALREYGPSLSIRSPMR